MTITLDDGNHVLFHLCLTVGFSKATNNLQNNFKLNKTHYTSTNFKLLKIITVNVFHIILKKFIETE
jgi:hypothetical protein